uniref:Rab-GAP TBC domain-containing protein n=1 Tax=Alexandrium monilatum TaxID=311494 RepID=A0A7S4R748_9DINO
MASVLPLALAAGPHLLNGCAAAAAASAVTLAAAAAVARVAGRATAPAPASRPAGTALSDAALHAERFWEVARRKRLRDGRDPGYYSQLVTDSRQRSVTKDEKQILKDLRRTFDALPPARGSGDAEHLLPLLHRILLAYVERGRSVSISAVPCVGRTCLGGAASHRVATTARPLLTDYPQGLNFLAGMSLLNLLPWHEAHCVRPQRCCCCKRIGGTHRLQALHLEEAAFWLLALLVEDVLDPDFFGAGVEHNERMGYIGGRGLKDLVLRYAEEYCPTMHEAMGHQVFRRSLSSVLDQWVLSVFVGCVPERLLRFLWELMLLPSPYQPVDWKLGHDASGQYRLPIGLATLTAFALAALQCCGEEPLRGSQELRRIAWLRRQGAAFDDLLLEAAEAMTRIKNSLKVWPADRDDALMNIAFAQIVARLADEGTALRLWEEVRARKQSIAAYEEDSDRQLDMLEKQTHFSRAELETLRHEFQTLVSSTSACPACDAETFRSIMRSAFPDFPMELSDRLFRRLDTFGAGGLSFAELARGLSALSLGTTDEKLQVAFDLFDSQGRRALTREDAVRLCLVLFRAAPAEDRTAFKVSEGSAEELIPSLVLKLLDLAKAPPESPDGEKLIAFEDFRGLVQQQQRLLGLFPWCLPKLPGECGGTACLITPRTTWWDWLW